MDGWMDGRTDMQRGTLWYKKYIKSTDNPKFSCFTSTLHIKVLILILLSNLLEKLIVAQLVRKLPTFNAT
jgi:hypothetical protein